MGNFIKLKSKKAIAMEELVRWIVFLAIFILLIVVAGIIFNKQKVQSEDLACQTQLAVASKGNPIGFSACHSYRIEFGKDSAIKYDMFQDDAEVYEYEYLDVLGKLKIRHPELDDLEINKNEIIPEEIVYYVFAEEMKLCDATYNVGSFKTGAYFFEMIPGNLNICQECAIFLFKEDFFPKNQAVASFQKINGFFQDIRVSETSNVSYMDYFNEKYDSGSFLSTISNIEINKIYKIIYRFQPDFSKLEGKAIYKYDFTLYLKSAGLNLIDSDTTINMCNFNLLLLPKGVKA